jgi:predicted ATPase/DNA-binding SARP family transcriptional activator/Tfp pilus assembly protein PilF
MRRLTFGLLGPTAVTGEGGPVDVHGVLRRRLLTRLLMVANQPVPLDLLSEDLWEGHPPASARTTLKSHVSLLRRALGPERLSHRDGAYVITVSPGELDVFLFEQEAADGQAARRDGDLRSAVGLLGQGLARWRGPALADAAGAAWAVPESVRLAELRASSQEAWLEARLGLGEHADVVSAAEAAVSEHPLREGLWAKLILALYRTGRQADALRAYTRVRELLRDELGIDPGPELAGLEGAVLRQEPALLVMPEPPDSPASGPGQAPASPARMPSQPNNLPSEFSSFVGREEQLSQIAALLSTSRLVTLTGVGGIGKTRLALRTARATLAGTGHGVWLAELASVADPAQVMRELARAIGVREEPGTDLGDVVTRRLSDGEQLLVLDNCEHVREAAAALAERLLRAGDGLRVLVTSREPLRVAGETVYQVPPMTLPASPGGGHPDENPEPGAVQALLLGSEAVQLFVERARSQQASFELLVTNSRLAASLCRRLDGIPLALELAAARMRSLTLADIESRLGDRFRMLTGGGGTAQPRQRTLRALIDWSYDLLSDDEKLALCRLSVFAGGWDLGAAERVAGGNGLDRGDVMDLLASLADQSLVQVDMTGDAARYRLLETVREYAAERLRSAGDEELQARAAHARLFLQLAEVAAPHFSHGGQVAYRARLAAEHDNLLIAFDHFLAAPDGSARALRLATALGWFWSSSGCYSEGVELLGAALGHPEVAAPTALRCAGLTMAGHLLWRSGDLTRAQVVLDEAVGIARQLAEPALIADALRHLAWVADRRGDKDRAISMATEAVELAAQVDETHVLSRAYDVRAAVRQERDPAGARSDYERALSYCESSANHEGHASTLNNLAVLELEQGNYDVARAHFDRALDLARQSHSAGILPYLEYGCGMASALDGDTAAAGPAFAEALGSARQTGQRSLVAYAMLGIAVTAAGSGWQPQAAALLGAADARFEELRETPEALEARLRAQALAVLRADLGDRFEQEYAAGRGLGAEAVALALRTGRPSSIAPSY